MSFIQSALGSIADLLYSIVIWLFLFLDTFVYSLINLAYQCFLAISQIRIFSDEDIYDLSQRVYIVIGVFALFFVAYALLAAIINPDSNKSETSLGKVIPNIAKAIVGIAIVPGIFNIMYDVQYAALCSNVIPKLVLGSAYADGFDINKGNTNSLGAQMSALLFRSFFYVKDENGQPYDLSQANDIASGIKENGCKKNSDDCLNLYQAYQDVENGGPFTIFQDFTDAVVDEKIGYFFILSTIAGGFCVYVLISLCLDMALRSVKLSYLQIIAPLPLLTLILPGQKKIFSNWLKKTVSCFLEVFTRLLVVVFAAYIMRTLDDVFNTVFGEGGVYCGEVDGLVWFLVKAATIIGLFWFIKKSPKIVSEVTGMDSKGFKLGIKDKLAESGAFSAIGGIGAGATASLRNLTKLPQNVMDGASKGKSIPSKVFRGGVGALSGVGSGLAGAGSGFVRGFKNNWNSKNYRDLVSNTSKSASDAKMARINRENYKMEHGNKITGVAIGHLQDARDAVRDNLVGFVTGSPTNTNAKSERLNKIESARKAIYDVVKNDNSVKAVDMLYEGEIERVKNSKLPLAAKQHRIMQLQADWGKEKDKALASVIKKRSGDIDMKRLLSNYSDIVANEIPLINETLTETGNIKKSNYKDLLDSPEKLRKLIMSGDAFEQTGNDKGIGQVIGKDAAKYSASLRIKQSQKDNGKK